MRQQRTKDCRPGLLLAAVLLVVPSLASATETDNVLAVIGEQQITEADIAGRIEGQMLKINNQIYTIKKRAVESAVTNALLTQEAEKRGLSLQQLLEQEVTSKAEPVSEEEIETFYNTNKARLRNKKFEEIRDQIEQRLQFAKRQQRQQAFVQELRKATTVKVLLAAPVVDVPIDGAPVRGPANAPVTLVEFSDFQ